MNDNSVAILIEFKLKATDAFKDTSLLKLFYNNSIPKQNLVGYISYNYSWQLTC